MKHVENNGLLFSTQDDISVRKSSQGGLRKKTAANRLDVASLDILAACVEQSLELNLRAAKIIEALKADLQKE